MNLSMDLRVRELYGAGTAAPGGLSAGAQAGGFAQVLAAAQSSADLEGCFRRAAETWQVPEELLKAVAKVESNFTADAVSPCGAQGVMQLMPDTARCLGVADSFDPAQNIMGGAKYLRQMLDRFDGDISMALAAYNAGPGTVEKCGGVPQFAQGYVHKVLGYMDGGAAVPVAAGGAAETGVPGDGLAADELAELILQASRSNGTDSQAAVRLLVERLFQKNGLESGEDDPLRPVLV